MTYEETSISEQTIKQIVEQFETELRKHLFSNKTFPVKCEVMTHYPEASQTLEIIFSKGEEK